MIRPFFLFLLAFPSLALAGDPSDKAAQPKTQQDSFEYVYSKKDAQASVQDKLKEVQTSVSQLGSNIDKRCEDLKASYAMQIEKLNEAKALINKMIGKQDPEGASEDSFPKTSLDKEETKEAN